MVAPATVPPTLSITSTRSQDRLIDGNSRWVSSIAGLSRNAPASGSQDRRTSAAASRPIGTKIRMFRTLASVEPRSPAVPDQMKAQTPGW